MLDDRFQITAGEATNPLWLRLKEHLGERIQIMREANDNESLDHVRTASIRASIKVYKEILDLEVDRKADT